MEPDDRERWWKIEGRAGLRRLLMEHWDPIGVADAPEAADEYDDYLGPLAEILDAGGSARDVGEYLDDVESKAMELGPTNPDRLLGVATRIVDWYAGRTLASRPTPSAIAVLERARADIDSGRLWKARDRLTAAFKHDPSDPQVLALLGNVYFEMGDLPHAGRLWLLTDRDGVKAEAAFSAFEERWGGNLGEKLKMVPFNGVIDDYPPPAQRRIRSLQDDARKSGIEWPRPDRGPFSTEESLNEEPLTLSGWLVGVLLAILGPGLWLLGIASAIYLLASWLTA